MKIKETNKTAHISWSPSQIYPCYLACGTAAQQLDASFSTTSCLELHNLNLSNPDVELHVDAAIETESRFNKLLWSNYLNNVIIGGCENGGIYLYDYETVLSKDPSRNPLLNKLDKHTGVVAALDINPFQSNLLASGAGSSEIFIWDLNNPTTPMTPGAKMPPLDDIQCVAWNNQVQHILASTCSGKCVVWDLRKNESIIKVSDSISKMKAKLVAWHPDIATQLCLSSEDDHSPFLQMWDLRFATSPVKVYSGHDRGILTFSWCPNDSSLLLSCGKDNRILTWNANSTATNGEIVHEIPSSQWCFDASWCTRYPSLVATSSFESLVSVYSLMGGKHDLKPETSNKIMDSFGVASNTPAQVPTVIETTIIPQLKYPPKWMKRTCGASFAFGGKLVTFEVDPTPPVSENPQQVQKSPAQKINIMQVVTDRKFVEQSQYLENALQSGQLIEYCNYKIQISESNADKEIWKFILGSFEKDNKQKFIDLLGFNNEELKEKIQNLINKNEKNGVETQLVSRISSQLSLDAPKLALNDSQLTSERTDRLLENDNSTPISRSHSPLNLAFNNQTENLLCESLLLGHYELAIDLCISETRFADAILIASFASKELLERTQQRYFNYNKTKFGKLLEGFLYKDWQKIVNNCNLNHWKEALAGTLTYTDNEQLSNLCNQLGNRIENEQQNKSDLLNACICYICSFNLDSLAKCWEKIKTDDNGSKNDFAEILQDSVEKLIILRYSLQHVHSDNKNLKTNKNFDTMNKILVLYAKLLAEQGCFLSALNYIKDSNDHSLQIMKDRLYNALGYSVVQQYGIAKPESPFKTTPHKASHHPSPLHHQRTSLGSPKLPSQTTSPQSTTFFNNNFQHPSHPTYQPVTPPSQHVAPPPNQQLNHHPQAPTSIQQQFNQPPVPMQQFNQQFNQHVPPPMPQNQPFFTPSQTQPLSSSSLPYGNQLPPVQPPPTTNNTSNPPPSVYTPIQQQTPVATELPTTKPISYQDHRPASAWNDPPIVPQKIKAPVIPKDPQVDTYKIFQPTMPTYAPPTYMQNNQIAQQQQRASRTNTPTPMQNFYDPQMPASNGFPSANHFNTNQVQQPPPQQQQQQQQQPPQQPRIPTPKPKTPIPSEHLIIQTTFDEMLRKCVEVSNAPIVKRKLDDVSKKLESLYDKLREKSLSDSVLQGLHTIIQYIQAYDYQSCLALHSQIVATSNFSEISAFMPGVKVLIQSCQQFNVTL